MSRKLRFRRAGTRKDLGFRGLHLDCASQVDNETRGLGGCPAMRAADFGENTHSPPPRDMGSSSYCGSDQIVLVGVGSGRRTGGQVQLGENVADVAIHGPLTDRELTRDGAVGPAAGEQPDDLQLPHGQT